MRLRYCNLCDKIDKFSIK